MADLSSSSFIPKRGPVTKRKRGNSSRRIYVFTLISYILMFATLLATGGVFLYDKYLDKQKSDELVSLNNEIDSFSDENMLRVVEFNSLLKQAANRVNHSGSIVSVFEALEDTVLSTAQIVTIDLVRKKDDKFFLEAEITTDSLGSTIFQRDTFGDNQKIQAINVTDVKTSNEILDDSTVNQEGSLPTQVTFSAELEVPLSAVPYVVKEINVVQPITVTEPDIAEEGSFIQSTTVTEPSTESGDLDNNEENI